MTIATSTAPAAPSPAPAAPSPAPAAPSPAPAAPSPAPAAPSPAPAAGDVVELPRMAEIGDIARRRVQQLRTQLEQLSSSVLEEQLERLRNLHGHLLSLPDPNAPPPAAPAPGPAAGPPMMPGAPPPMPTMPPPGGAPPGAPIQ